MSKTDTTPDATVEEAKLTTKERKKLPKSSFAIPPDRYPIHDESHARNALSRVAQHGSSSEKARVRAAVCRRYPSMGVCGERKKMKEEGLDPDSKDGFVLLLERAYGDDYDVKTGNPKKKKGKKKVALTEEDLKETEQRLIGRLEDANTSAVMAAAARDTNSFVAARARADELRKTLAELRETASKTSE